MYFSALKRLIAGVEEKMFYDVALLFLESQGYKKLSVVDGSGDGGRDVISSRSDLRIQLSVRKDWQSKINEEAVNTYSAGQSHFIYVTNRVISPDAEADFKTNQYTSAGVVDVTIFDLNFIATSLNHSSLIARAYGTLGANPSIDLFPTPQEVAISSLLLFGVEAQDLRGNVVEANLCATLFDQSEAISEAELIQQVSGSIPGSNVDRLASSAISKLRASRDIVGSAKNVKLSNEKADKIRSARLSFANLLEDDISNLISASGLSRVNALKLLSKARDLLVRGRGFDGNGAAEEDFRSFLLNHGLRHRKKAVYDSLSTASTIRQFQFGVAVDAIFNTDTFDIYRALGGKTDLSLVLDSNVVLPLMLSLEFPNEDSRYALAVLSLDEVCRSHGINMMVPSVYLNEMANHGRKALDYLEIYPVLPNEARYALRSSRNAFLSHYSYIEDKIDISLAEFLAHFGLNPGSSIRRIENRLLSIIEGHGIKTGFSEWFDQRVRDEIAEKKEGDPRVLIDHDAAVATNLINNSEKGYILATWDNVMIDVVQDLSRIYAENPARINDFLSAINGQITISDRSEDLLFTMLHIDERPAQRLAEKLDSISQVSSAYKFKAFVDEARTRRPDTAVSDLQMLEFLRSLDESAMATPPQSPPPPSASPITARDTAR